MTENSTDNRDGWAGAWPDLLAFAAGLAMAWKFQWQTRDLVWSLWLSSLVVGYAMIVWSIFGLEVFVATQAWGDRTQLRTEPRGPLVAGGMVFLVGGLFVLAFFTVHFGMFHYVHSIFLNSFFPVEPGRPKFSPGLALYWEVFRRYWWFLPAAALAERKVFRLIPTDPGPADTSVTAEDVAVRQMRNFQAAFGGGGLMSPYRNVGRMHLLIFFFAFVHFAKLENFGVYAVVYAVYFFPWRLIKRDKA